MQLVILFDFGGHFMEMRNCRKCNKVFVFIRTPICSDCEKSEEAIFETVRTYIKENPLKKIEEVAMETDVSVKRINKYIREGRIDVVNSKAISVSCESCGVPMKKGRYCSKCTMLVKSQMDQLFADNKNPELVKKNTSAPKMHHKKNL
jgi:uncharacterized protein